MSLLQWLGYPAALVMGLALGLTGGGGSILTVPILVYLFGVPALDATLYSLAVVGLVALWGAVSAKKNGDLDLATALFFGGPGVLGVLLSRKILLPSLPDLLRFASFEISKASFLLILFSVLMLAAATSMIMTAAKGAKSAASAEASSDFKNKLALVPLGLIVGVVAGFVGAGGGFLIVPALVQIAKLDMKIAVGTSLFVIALQSLLGVAGDINALQRVDMQIFAAVFVLAIIGMTLGGRLRSRVSTPHLKRGFGFFVLIVGIFIFFQEISRANH